MSLANDLLPWFQISGTVFTAIAAVAAAVSARAASLTAGRADDTSRRAAEALSRATRPSFGGLLSQSDERGREPQPMELYIFNNTAHPGRLLSVRMERPDGTRLGEATGLSVDIGGGVGSPIGHRNVPLGLVRRARPNVRPGDPDVPGGVPVIWTVEFTDAAGLARWRQRRVSDEMVRFEDDDERPLYLYTDGGGIEEPELVQPVEAPAVRRWWWGR